MKKLWADNFAYQEKVLWETFWSVFPEEIDPGEKVSDRETQ